MLNNERLKTILKKLLNQSHIVIFAILLFFAPGIIRTIKKIPFVEKIIAPKPKFYPGKVIDIYGKRPLIEYEMITIDSHYRKKKVKRYTYGPPLSNEKMKSLYLKDSYQEVTEGGKIKLKKDEAFFKDPEKQEAGGLPAFGLLFRLFGVILLFGLFKESFIESPFKGEKNKKLLRIISLGLTILTASLPSLFLIINQSHNISDFLSTVKHKIFGTNVIASGKVEAFNTANSFGEKYKASKLEERWINLKESSFQKGGFAQAKVLKIRTRKRGRILDPVIEFKGDDGKMHQVRVMLSKSFASWYLGGNQRHHSAGQLKDEKLFRKERITEAKTLYKKGTLHWVKYTYYPSKSKRIRVRVHSQNIQHWDFFKVLKQDFLKRKKEAAK